MWVIHQYLRKYHDKYYILYIQMLVVVRLAFDFNALTKPCQIIPIHYLSDLWRSVCYAAHNS